MIRHLLLYAMLSGTNNLELKEQYLCWSSIRTTFFLHFFKLSTLFSWLPVDFCTIPLQINIFFNGKNVPLLNLQPSAANTSATTDSWCKKVSDHLNADNWLVCFHICKGAPATGSIIKSAARKSCRKVFWTVPRFKRAWLLQTVLPLREQH